jgi:methyl-accepting chemotaxis protein
MFSFGISGRAIILAVAAIVNVLLVTASGWWGMATLERSVQETAQVGLVLGNQSYADMMHDALHSDVLVARQNTQMGKSDGAQQTYADIEEHGNSLIAKLKESMALIQSPELKRQFAAVLPVADSYRVEALRTAKAAYEQPESYPELYGTFQQAFSRMETSMEELAGKIETFQAEFVKGSENSTSFVENLLIISTLLALFVTVLSTWLQRKTVVKPLQQIEQSMVGVAEGKFDTAVPFLERRDEIGAMARALDVFRKNGLEIERLNKEQKDSFEKARQERQQARQKMASEFEAQVGGIATAVAQSASEVQTFARAMTSSAESTTSEAGTVATALDSAATNVQTAASAGEELNASIQEISRQIGRSADLVLETVADARRTDETVQDLSRASQKIGDVVSIISDIAAQTNLLALNATIEAARAGEAGKGFAVVASEVKNLANQTAQATSEISHQITASQSVTGEAISAIRKISQRISEMNTITVAIRSAMSQQEDATREISHSMSAAAAGTTQVSTALSNVSKVAAETGEVAGRLSHSSKSLTSQSETLRTAVDRFANFVRNSG